MDVLRVDFAQLPRSSKGIGDCADQLRSIFQSLDARLSAEGRCWGTDETGKTFNSQYEPARTNAYGSFASLAGKLDDAQTAVAQMSVNYQAAETASGA